MNFEIWATTNHQPFNKYVIPVLKGHKVNTTLKQIKDELPRKRLDPNLPNLILVMGTPGLKAMQAEDVAAKNRSITSLRGTPHKYGKAQVYFTFGPDLIDNDYSKLTDIQWDVVLACRIFKTGSPDPVLGKYRYVEDLTDAITYIESRWAKTQKKVQVSLDLETVGLNPFDPKKHIVSLSVTYKKGHSEVLYFGSVEDMPKQGSPLWGQINDLCTSVAVKMVGANLKYDILWLRLKLGILITNHTMDTTLVGSLLDENRSNSLNTHAKVYTELGGYDDEFNRDFDKSRMDLVPKEKLLPYGGGDTDACYRVANAQRRELLKDQRLANFYMKLLHPASKAFEDMEYEGVLIDVPYFKNLEQEMTQHLEELTSEAVALMPGRLRAKHDGDLSLTRPALIREFLFTPMGLNLKPIDVTPKAKLASTTMEHLQKFSDHPEAAKFVEILKRYGSAKKTLSTYVTGFLKHLRQDGRLHPTAILFKGAFNDGGDESGTVTGRTAFRDPAMQTLPKHTDWAKHLRRGYIAPPGYVLVSWDYSQGELRVTACVANEEAMIQAYRSGLDLHLKTGSQLNGIDLDDALAMKKAGDKQIKIIRQGGKAGNFGLIYGMSAAGYQYYAESSYGVSLTMEQANVQRDVFFQTYPGLTKWHKQYHDWARNTGMVRSPLGRIRHLPNINSVWKEERAKAERQAINSPIQSTLSDLSQLALALFREQYGNPDGCRFCMMIHDALVAYVKIDEFDMWVPRVQETMENLPLKKLFGWTPQLKFITDYEYGPNLAEMEEVANG